MGANSKHYLDVRQWIIKVIDSCITVSQVISAKKLIKAYTEQYPSRISYDIGQYLRLKANDQIDYILKNSKNAEEV